MSHARDTLLDLLSSCVWLPPSPSLLLLLHMEQAWGQGGVHSPEAKALFHANTHERRL